MIVGGLAEFCFVRGGLDGQRGEILTLIEHVLHGVNWQFLILARGRPGAPMRARPQFDADSDLRFG